MGFGDWPKIAVVKIKKYMVRMSFSANYFCTCDFTVKIFLIHPLPLLLIIFLIV